MGGGGGCGGSCWCSVLTRHNDTRGAWLHLGRPRTTTSTGTAQEALGHLLPRGHSCSLLLLQLGVSLSAVRVAGTSCGTLTAAAVACGGLVAAVGVAGGECAHLDSNTAASVTTCAPSVAGSTRKWRNAHLPSPPTTGLATSPTAAAAPQQPRAAPAAAAAAAGCGGWCGQRLCGALCSNHDCAKEGEDGVHVGGA